MRLISRHCAIIHSIPSVSSAHNFKHSKSNYRHQTVRGEWVKKITNGGNEIIAAKVAVFNSLKHTPYYNIFKLLWQHV